MDCGVTFPPQKRRLIQALIESRTSAKILQANQNVCVELSSNISVTLVEFGEPPAPSIGRTGRIPVLSHKMFEVSAFSIKYLIAVNVLIETYRT